MRIIPRGERRRAVFLPREGAGGSRDRKLGGMNLPVRRTLAAVSLALLPFAAVAACSGEGATTECTIDSCTVTFDRGVEASASILGIKAELVGVDGDSVTLRIAGQQITVPREGEGEADGLSVGVESITQDQVVVKISRGGGEG